MSVIFSFNCMNWFLLPSTSDSMIKQVSKAAKGSFIGDPAYVYEHPEISRKGEGDYAEEEEIVVCMIGYIKPQTKCLWVAYTIFFFFK